MIHGGDIYSLKHPEAIKDFSSNINPLGPPLGLKEELNKAYENLTAYPDINYRQLKSNIAEYLGCSSTEVIVGNGAVEIISNTSLMAERVVAFTPCFSEYIRRAKVFGKEVVLLSLNQNFKIDMRSLRDNLKQGDMLVLGNPNNPTGLRIPEAELKLIYEIVKERDGFLLLDEAFFEFCPEDYDSIELFKSMDNVCVIRAATKFFALPGIRLGYGAASPAFVKKYSEIESPWSVNSYACAAANSIFRDKDYIKRTKDYLNNERKFLLNGLSNINWIRPYNSDANFILLKLLKHDEEKIFHDFLKKGIMIRRASNFEGLDNSYIRVAVKDRESNNKLLKLFREAR